MATTIGQLTTAQLYEYVVKVAEKTISNSTFTDIVYTGTITQSLPGYYVVSLTNGGDTENVNAFPMNSVNTFAKDDYVYLLQANVSSGDYFQAKYYIFGLVSETNENYANLTDAERFSPIASQSISNPSFQYGAETLLQTVTSTSFLGDIKVNGAFAIAGTFFCKSATNIQDYGIRVKFEYEEAQDLYSVCKFSNGEDAIFDLSTEWFIGQPFNLDQVRQKRVVILPEEINFDRISVYAFTEKIVGSNVTGEVEESQLTASNIALEAGSLIDISGRFSLDITTIPGQKNYFRYVEQGDSNANEIGLQATAYYNQQPLAADAIQYYWLVKDSLVKSYAVGDEISKTNYDRLAKLVKPLSLGDYCVEKEATEAISEEVGSTETASTDTMYVFTTALPVSSLACYQKEAGAGWYCLNNYELAQLIDSNGTIYSSNIKVWDCNNNTFVLDIKENSKLKDKDGTSYGRAGVDYSFLFDQYTTVMKCLVKYRTTVFSSPEKTIYNYAKNNFDAVIRSSSETNRLIFAQDRITLTCNVNNLNDYISSDINRTMTYQWFLVTTKEDGTSEATAIKEASQGKNVLRIKDNGIAAQDGDDYIEYEMDEVSSISVYCEVKIAGEDAASGAITLVTDTVTVESLVQLSQSIHRSYVYKYYISPNMGVEFGQGATLDTSDWNGDWVVKDYVVGDNGEVAATASIIADAWTDLKNDDVWIEDDLADSGNSSAAYNKLKNDVSTIWPHEKYKNNAAVQVGDRPYLYYTRQERLYLYANGERVDYTSSDEDDLTPVEVKAWEVPVLLRQVEVEELSNNSVTVVEVKNDDEINQINIFNQLTKNGTEDGIYYSDDVYVLTEDESPQINKAYYTYGGVDSDGKPVYNKAEFSASEGFAAETDYYELDQENKNKLYINASYINTGTLRVGSPKNEIFYASIGNPAVRIAGFNVTQNEISHGADRDVIISPEELKIGSVLNINKNGDTWTGSFSGDFSFTQQNGETITSSSEDLINSTYGLSAIQSEYSITTDSNGILTKDATNPIEEVTFTFQCLGNLPNAEIDTSKISVSGFNDTRLKNETTCVRDNENKMKFYVTLKLNYASDNPIDLSTPITPIVTYQFPTGRTISTAVSIKSNAAGTPGTTATSSTYYYTEVEQGSTPPSFIIGNADANQNDLNYSEGKWELRSNSVWKTEEGLFETWCGAKVTTDDNDITTYISTSVYKIQVVFYGNNTCTSEISATKIPDMKAIENAAKYQIVEGKYIDSATPFKYTVEKEDGTLVGYFPNYTDSVTNGYEVTGTLGGLSTYHGYPRPTSVSNGDVGRWCFLNNRTVISGGAIATGSITADQIATNALQSQKYAPGADDSKYSASGTFFNLADGSISAPKFAIDDEGKLYAEDAKITGEIVATKLTIANIPNKKNLLRDSKINTVITDLPNNPFNSGWVSRALAFCPITERMDSNKKYTLSVWYYVNAWYQVDSNLLSTYKITAYLQTASGDSIDGVSSNFSFYDGIRKTYFVQESITFNGSADAARIDFYLEDTLLQETGTKGTQSTNKKVGIECVQLEEGTVATPWAPNPIDQVSDSTIATEFIVDTSTDGGYIRMASKSLYLEGDKLVINTPGLKYNVDNNNIMSIGGWDIHEDSITKDDIYLLGHDNFRINLFRSFDTPFFKFLDTVNIACGTASIGTGINKKYYKNIYFTAYIPALLSTAYGSKANGYFMSSTVTSGSDSVSCYVYRYNLSAIASAALPTGAIVDFTKTVGHIYMYKEGANYIPPIPVIVLEKGEENFDKLLSIYLKEERAVLVVPSGGSTIVGPGSGSSEDIGSGSSTVWLSRLGKDETLYISTSVYDKLDDRWSGNGGIKIFLDTNVSLDEEERYLTAPALLTQEGRILAKDFITTDGTITISSSNFESWGYNGNRLTLQSDKILWFTDTNSLGVHQNQSTSMNGCISSAWCSEVMSFYSPHADDDDNNKTIFNTHMSNGSYPLVNSPLPLVKLFSNAIYTGMSPGEGVKQDPNWPSSAGSTSPAIPLRVLAGGYWVFLSDIYCNYESDGGLFSRVSAIEAKLKSLGI